MKISDILEGRFRKAIVMYHGTSSKFLNSIMKNGMQPDPKSRIWDEDPNTSVHSPSRVSLPGSYWTSNLLTATGSASTAARKFEGTSIVVMALINEQSAYADEDSINYGVTNAWQAWMKMYCPGIVSDAVIYGYIKWMINPLKHAEMIDVFAEKFHAYSKTSDKMPQDNDLLGKVFHAYMMRILAHQNKDPYAMKRDLDYLRSNGLNPEIPDVRTAEQNYLAVRDQLTKRYRATTYKRNDSFNHTLRITQPVGFRGGNRIICILEVYNQNKNGVVRDPLILFYGQIPDQFRTDWHERMGRWPGVVDSRGQRLEPPRSKE